MITSSVAFLISLVFIFLYLFFEITFSGEINDNFKSNVIISIFVVSAIFLLCHWMPTNSEVSYKIKPDDYLLSKTGHAFVCEGPNTYNFRVDSTFKFDSLNFYHNFTKNVYGIQNGRSMSITKKHEKNIK